MVKLKIGFFVLLLAMWMTASYYAMSSTPEMEASLQQLKGTGNFLVLSMVHIKNIFFGLIGPLALFGAFLKLFAKDIRKALRKHETV